MAVSLGFAIILGLSISFCSCYDFSISRDPYYKEVYQFVKHVIIDWNQKHLNDTNDISIINLDNDTSLYDIVRQAIPKENPILLPQKACKDITKYSKLRQSSLLILVSKVYGDINEYAAPIFQCIYSGFWTPLTNVIVVPPKNLQADVDVLYPGQVLTISRALNFIVPYIQNGKILGIYRGNILRGEFDTLERTTNTDVLFNDKLSDMHGYPYRTVIYVSDKRKFTNGTALISIEVKVANTMAMKQNAKFFVGLVKTENTNIRHAIYEDSADMLLNLGSYAGLLINQSVYKTVNLYETNGFCVLVSKPPVHESFLKFIVMPFDAKVWYALFLTLFFATLTWQTFHKFFEKGMVSGRYMVIDILLTFVQQSVKIRRGRFVLKIMLQIFIFMMIFMANIYQGMITSILMEPMKYQKVNNIQELLSREYVFYADISFYGATSEFSNDLDLGDKLIPLDNWIYNSNYTKQFQDVMTVNSQNVLIVLCDAVNDLLETQIDRNIKGRDVYYEMPQKILSYYESILLTKRSPFYERLNDLSLRIHESGIKQHWSNLADTSSESYTSDSSILGMNEMKPIIKAYLEGVIFASHIFFLEIFKNGLKIIYRRWIKGCLKAFRRYFHRSVAPRVQKV